MRATQTTIEKMRRGTVWPMLFLAVCITLACGAATALGQAADDADEIPEPKDITLATPDYVQLAATFYPGTKGKDTVPVILLHMLGRTRNDYSELAPYLQQLGHAVLVPDLRGHGDSTLRRKIDRRTGNVTTEPIEAAKMSKIEFANMALLDMLTLKQFLIERNNASELNIEKLCVVGAGLGSSVAVNFTYLDWTRLPEGNRKMGQDVKALVLISPEWSTQGLPVARALTQRPPRIMVYDKQLKGAFKNPIAIDFSRPVEIDFRKEVSVFILVGGGNRPATNDAARLHKMLKQLRPAEVPKEQQDLYYGTLDTVLQGTTMLGVRGLDLEEYIAKFIHRRAADRSFPWAKRTDPYDRG